MIVLSLSDKTMQFIYSPQVRHRFPNVDLIFGCGDLDYYYLEYVLNALNRPLFFVRGNHDKVVEYNSAGQRTGPAGGTDLHRQVIEYQGLLLAGVEGSLNYRIGVFQYTQGEMLQHVLALVPGLLLNRLRWGRFLDVFITHAPPAGIHDREDLPHQGIKAFAWFLRVFQPAYHFHGHIHIYRPDTEIETQSGRTRVINTYSYRETKLELGWQRQRPRIEEESGI
jgi:Icc-related predicted phosphoesterase